MRADDVIARLVSLGYAYDEEKDAPLLEFAMLAAAQYIRNGCNVDEVPEGLSAMTVDWACGYFLQSKKGGGQLEGFNVNLDAAVKQIKEGDTNVVFAFGEGAKTPEQRLDALIGYLLTYGKGQLATYRRLAW